MTRLDSGALAAPTGMAAAGGGGRRRRSARLEQRLAGRPRADAAAAPTCRWCRLDAVLIEQVLVNLLDNAIKYTPAGTPIEIWASASGSEVSRHGRRPGPGPATGRRGARLRQVLPQPRRRSARGRRPGPGHLPRRSSRPTAAASVPRHARAAAALLRFTLPLEGQPPQVLPESVAPAGRRKGGA